MIRHMSKDYAQWNAHFGHRCSLWQMTLASINGDPNSFPFDFHPKTRQLNFPENG